MSSRVTKQMVPVAARWAGRATLAAAVATALLLAGCGDKKSAGASQTAAKVNKEEITVHQINFVLQQQRGLKPEQADAASKQILERLIDQQLAIQQAEELKLDRDPRVVQAIEAARRDIIARAYVDRTGEAAAKPTPEDIKKYYDEKPALFKERRIYSIQELSIEAKPEQVGVLRSQLQAAKAITDFIEYLKTNNFRFSGNQAVRPAEQLPLNMVDTFAKMTDGQAMLVPTPTGAQVVVLAGSRSEPVDEARAKPAIEQFLLNDAKRKLIENNLKSLRAAAKVQYVGKFAEAASAPAGGDAASAPSVEVKPPEPASPAPASASASAPDGAASGGLDASSISKGMGFKK